MALIHTASQPAIRGQADLFSTFLTDTTVESSFYAEFKPVVNIQDSDAQFEFKIMGNSSQYLNFGDHFLSLVVRVELENGDPLPPATDISVTNNTFHSLFTQCDVYVNNQIMSSSNNLYPYKSYFETVFSYSKDYIDSQAKCALYYPEDDASVLSAANPGYAARKRVISDSKQVELIGKLHIDLASQNRYILNDTNISIVLTRASDLFAILCPNCTLAAGGVFVPKIKFLDAAFFIRKEVLYPSIVVTHQKLLDKGELAKYFYRKSDLKYFSIPRGNQSFIEENVFVSNVPTKIILALVSSKGFNGDLKLNPYNFEHYDLNYIGVSVNNMPMPIRPLNLNFTNNRYLTAYYLLFTSLGNAGRDSGLPFSRYNYATGNAFFSFDICPSDNENNILHLQKSGSVRIELKFGTALPEAVHCLVYSDNQAVLEIDKYRQIASQ